jgi:hypothetical protein
MEDGEIVLLDLENRKSYYKNNKERLTKIEFEYVKNHP